jgi:hypothetical protein
LSFTSVAPTQADLTQVNGIEEEEIEVDPYDPSLNDTYRDTFPAVQDDEDDDVRILEQPSGTSSVTSLRDKGVASSRIKGTTALGKKVERVGQKRKQDGKVVEMMGRFLERKEQQAEVENTFTIPACIAVVDGIEDLSDDEKVDAYDVFKDAQNRAIFMTAKERTRLKWLRKKIHK